MIWCFKQIEDLRERHREDGKELTQSEITNLEEYVKRKKQFLDNPGTVKEQFYKAENLLEQVQGEQQ